MKVTGQSIVLADHHQWDSGKILEGLGDVKETTLSKKDGSDLRTQPYPCGKSCRVNQSEKHRAQ